MTTIPSENDLAEKDILLLIQQLAEYGKQKGTPRFVREAAGIWAVEHSGLNNALAEIDRLRATSPAVDGADALESLAPAGRDRDIVKYMVDRFLGWKIPRDTFNPDCGISFNKEQINTHTPYPSKYEPIGTNLFDAEQATAMVRYMLEGLPAGLLKGAEGSITVPFNPCLAKLRPGELFFVLLGRDKQAPLAIEAWADAREKAEGPCEWVEEARTVAAKMREASGAPGDVKGFALAGIDTTVEIIDEDSGDAGLRIAAQNVVSSYDAYDSVSGDPIEKLREALALPAPVPADESGYRKAIRELRLTLSSIFDVARAPLGDDTYIKRLRGIEKEAERRLKLTPLPEASVPAHEASDKIGSWLSAALDDPTVCEEMKRDIRAWFDAGQPVPAAKVAESSDADMRAFGASEAACYHWPEDTELHRACREAYCRGAADCLPSGDTGKLRVALEALKSADVAFAEMGIHHSFQPRPQLTDAICYLESPAIFASGEAGKLRALLQEARDTLNYLTRGLGSVTSDKIKNKLIPAINEALALPASVPAPVVKYDQKLNLARILNVVICELFDEKINESRELSSRIAADPRVLSALIPSAPVVEREAIEERLREWNRRTEGKWMNAGAIPFLVTEILALLPPAPVEAARLFKIGAQLAISILTRLEANYQTDRDKVADSDLDNEQPITISFRGQLGDIRNARTADACLRRAITLLPPAHRAGADKQFDGEKPAQSSVAASEVPASDPAGFSASGRGQPSPNRAGTGQLDRAPDGVELHAKLVEDLIEQTPYKNHPWARVSLAIAAGAIRRGRHLTAEEQLANLQAALEESETEDRASDWAEAMLEALQVAEQADQFHHNCEECEGLGAPEACEKCFPLADKARVLRRAVLACPKCKGTGHEVSAPFMEWADDETQVASSIQIRCRACGGTGIAALPLFPQAAGEEK